MVVKELVPIVEGEGRRHGRGKDWRTRTREPKQARHSETVREAKWRTKGCKQLKDEMGQTTEKGTG